MHYAPKRSIHRQILLLFLLKAFAHAQLADPPAAGQRPAGDRCTGGREGIAILSVAMIPREAGRRSLRSDADKNQVLQWLSTGNKAAYVSGHKGYQLYTVFTPLVHDRHPSWQKLIALQAVMQHSCAQWIWALDTDIFIFDLAKPLEDVINSAVEDWRRQQPGRGNDFPDIVAAKDCNEHNAGSMIFRNSAWAQQHLADTWSTNGPTVPAIDAWWEQAAFIHLRKHVPGVADHYAWAPQRAMNAYPPTGTACTQDHSGMYQASRCRLHARVVVSCTAA